MDNNDSRSGGFPLIVVALLAILLILAFGGGGIFLVTTMKYREAAERARLEAMYQAEQAERAALETARAKAVADQVVKDLTVPDKTPADPLQTVNNAFRAAYKAARQDALAAGGPVIVTDGDDLVLIRNGKRTPITVVPPLYHELKTFGHIPLAAFLLTRPGKAPTFDDERRAELTMFLSHIDAVRDRAKNASLTDEQRRRHQTILDETTRYLTDAEKAQTVKPEVRAAFAKKLAPVVLAHAADAARLQIDGMHKQMTAWRADLPADEWKQLKVVVMGSQMPRAGNLAVQYFAWLLGEPGEGKRIVYSEGIFDETKAVNLLGTHYLDTEIGATFFDDDRRMHRDLLADAAKEILKGMKQ